MTTTTELDAHTKAAALLAIREQIAELRQAAQSLEAELLDEIRQTGGKALMDHEFRIEVTEASGGFDPSVLTPLKEVLPEDDLIKCWAPEHTETVVVPEKWDGRKLGPLARKYGGKVLAIYESARLPGKQTLTVERK